MAIRKGNVNPVQWVIGVASPQIVLFLNAGPASVWDWGDNIRPIGLPIAFDSDCVERIDAHVYLPVDSAYAVSGACGLAVDTSIATAGGIDVGFDHCLGLYQVSHFTKDNDLQAAIQNPSYTLFNECIGISNAIGVDFEIETDVIHILTKQFDLSLQPFAYRSLDADTLIEVPYPMLFIADTSTVINRTISSETDQRIVILGSLARTVDLMQSVRSNIEQQVDTCITVGKWSDFDTDQALCIGNTAALSCDAAWIIKSLVSVSSDLQIRTATRLVPDTDSIQIIYGLIIRESHSIQV